ncbi:MAG: glycoside hydrolase family 3 C-terminal domain-containing protein [Clostridiales Family XIII bacterium]|jgi:beta-glucosidase|nr:glycoside hydrolase family 3 C-terminal domain-containing protein [Clostridiales Family XIII bacterium]
MDINATMKKMTLEEKAMLCSGLNDHFTKPIPRLDIPSVDVEDGPHGLRKQMGEDTLGRHPGTCFPSDVALASSWNPDVARCVGEALSRECLAADVSVLLGPAMNIKRSPLCGRNFEYYSEDPFQSGTMAAAYVQGLQSQGTGACMKHFAANNQEFLRMHIDAEIDERALREIYLTGFEIVVKEAHPWAVMAAYNRLNGAYCTESRRLLTDILRDEWGFDGIAMSDWGAVNIREDALAAGLELEMPTSGGYGDRRIVAAVREGRLQEEVLDVAVERMLRFIDKATKAKRDVNVDRQSQHAAAVKAAEECIVLLKNDRNTLPLKKQGIIAVIGGMAETPRYQGGGSSNVAVEQVDIPLEEMRGRAGDAKVLYAEGYVTERNDIMFQLVVPECPCEYPDGQRIAEAVSAAKKADCAVVFAGLPESYESEGGDRKHLRIPEGQTALIEAVAAVQPNTVVVLNNGAPVEMPWLGDVAAVVESYVCGQGFGRAVSRVLFGEVNPSGKLAETFPKSLSDTPADFPALAPDLETTIYREGILVGYRYYDAKEIQPLFPFGHGLSYTTFAYSGLRLGSDAIFDDETLEVALDVANTGEMAGAEVVQFYVAKQGTAIFRPVAELKGFAKVFLKPGETKQVSVHLPPRAFSWYDPEKASWVVEAGGYEIRAAASSRDIRAVAVLTVSNRTPEMPRFDRNSSIGSVIRHPAGREVMHKLLEGFVATSFMNQDGQDPAVLTDVILDRFSDMTLKSLKMLSAQTPMEVVDHLVDALNKAVNR